MKTIIYITNRIALLKNIILRTIKVEPFNAEKELDHTRFKVDEKFCLEAKKGKGSLLFHMYAKENETLFI